ncbi:MAG: GNAT family N-acetyltransferase [Xanthomonadaceae bacterium]|nr:GNAT family N-acetyltransferase [Xanthomonadaceae bacterium]
MTTRQRIHIRTATVADAELIFGLIVELARCERAGHAVKTTPERLRESLFGETATAHALVCELDGKPVGYVVYFFNYSTWLGCNGLYLEDLYVTPEARGQGAGKALLKYLARQAVEKKCGRFEWAVLDWNTPAIEFYRAAGARPMDEWTVYRLDGQALRGFASA